MTLLVPNDGESNLLGRALGKESQEASLTLKLYKSTNTPSETDTAATYTEADFTGYSAKTLANASWTITPGAPTDAAYAQQTFTSTADQSSQDVYGYYVIGTTSTEIYWAELFTDGPYAIANNGDSIAVTPHITLD